MHGFGRFILAGLMIAVVVLAGACSPPEPGSHEWLVGSWQPNPSDVRDQEITITFNADGTGLTFNHGRDAAEAWRYTLVGTQLTIIELKENGETKKTIKQVLSALTPMSFDIAMSDGDRKDGDRKVTLTRR